MPDSQVFRERVASTPEAPAAPTVSAPQESYELKGGETKASTPETPEERTIDIWEGLNRKRYIDEYFDTHATSSEFMVKMPTSEIDKFIRAEMEERGFEKTIDNYQEVLREIEEEIGSSRLELFKRFTKLTGYIRAIMKFRKAKALKEKYIISEEE